MADLPSGTPALGASASPSFNLLAAQRLLHATVFGASAGVAVSRAQFFQLSDHRQAFENAGRSLKRMAGGLDLLATLLAEQPKESWPPEALSGLLAPMAEQLSAHAAALMAATTAGD
ncbi:MAG: hypothetical protein FWG56_12105 [Desulfovibrionaceae bacterium]|jgi:hypothetical protein|nr:hypothetical protein [Desulfovibrionaceae bacterium]